MYQDQKSDQIPSSFPNYSKNIFNKPNLVLDHSKDSCKHLEDFISAFNKRVQTQMTYHKNLKDCSKLLDRYIDGQSKKCLSFISSAFKVDNQQRANQAKQLADSLKTQVLTPLLDMSKDFSNFTKTATKSLKKLNKDYTYFKENYQKYLIDFEENDTDTKQMLITKNIYKFTSQYSLQKKNKMISKTMQSIKEKSQYQKLYKSSVRQYNQIIQIYRKDVIEMLNQLQIKQRQQVKLQSDCIRKLIVCQISMFKNVQYDLINISKQMQNMDGQNDIQAFKNQSQNMQTKQIEKDMVLKEILSDKSLLTFSLKNVQDQYFSWLLQMKKSNIIRCIIQQRHKQFKNIQQNTTNIEEILNQKWQNIPKKLFQSQKSVNGIQDQIKYQESFKKFIQITQLINLFWLSQNQVEREKINQFRQLIKKSHFIRIIAYLYIQQYRIQHQVQLKWQNYINASQFISIFLSQCQAKNDSFVVKGLLGLLFTFSGSQQNSKKLLFQAQPIYNSTIWKRDDFWQSAIFESTYQQMAGISVQKGQTQAQTLLRQKNIIFSQLASYCHYMLMLGMIPKTVKVVVGRYCRLYEMTTQQNTDLSKMIRNTYRQIKQNINNQVIKVNGNK